MRPALLGSHAPVFRFLASGYGEYTPLADKKTDPTPLDRRSHHPTNPPCLVDRGRPSPLDAWKKRLAVSENRQDPCCAMPSLSFARRPGTPGSEARGRENRNPGDRGEEQNKKGHSTKEKKRSTRQGLSWDRRRGGKHVVSMARSIVSCCLPRMQSHGGRYGMSASFVSPAVCMLVSPRLSPCSDEQRELFQSGSSNAAPVSACFAARTKGEREAGGGGTAQHIPEPSSSRSSTISRFRRSGMASAR